LRQPEDDLLQRTAAALAQRIDGEEISSLAGLWRLLAGDVLSVLASLQVTKIADLLAVEVLSPSLGEPLAPALVDAIAAHRPQLSPPTVKRLADRLRDEAPLARPAFEERRAILEAWALSQAGEAADAFVLDVVCKATPRAADASVRREALACCRARPELFAKAAAWLATGLREAPSAGGWQAAAGLLEDAPTPPAELVRLLLHTAPQCCPQEELGEALTRAAKEDAPDALRARLQGAPLPDSPGSRALIQLAERVLGRAQLLGLLLERQHHLWPTVEGRLPELGREDWERLLEGAAAGGALPPPIVGLLVRQAPVELSPSLVRLAVRHASSPDDEIVSAAAERLRERADAGVADADLVWWPKDGDDRELVLLGALVRKALAPDRHAALVTQALERSRISPEAASALLPHGVGEGYLDTTANDPSKEVELVRLLGTLARKGARPRPASTESQETELNEATRQTSEARSPRP
jgi:hypothetical protein